MGLNALNDILKRQAERKGIVKKLMELPPPLITDGDSVTEHNKKIKEFQSSYLDACSFVDYDIDVLRKAVELVAIEKANIEDAVSSAHDKTPLDAKLREKLDKQREAEEEAERKKTGDIPGQQKIELAKGKKSKDDGSTAEAASAVTSKKLEEVK
jgi:ABC-type nitrate/sulfonate/bicarbonate transport system substrate-binding protein